MDANLNPTTLPAAQRIALFVGGVLTFRFISLLAEDLYRRFIPSVKEKSYVTRTEFTELKKELIVMRELQLLMAVKSGVDVSEIKKLVAG